MTKYPKFEDALDNKIATSRQQQATDGYGIVMSYTAVTNRATVMMSNHGTSQMGQVYYDVPCPTSIGVQSVAPEPGRPAWISFKDGMESFPVITHFFNHVYDQIDYNKQTTAKTYMPKYMIAM